MRTALTLSFAAIAISLSACASTSGESRYGAELQQLSADCKARGGILVPTGQLTARPQADNACQITGGTTRIDQNPPRI